MNQEIEADSGTWWDDINPEVQSNPFALVFIVDEFLRTGDSGKVLWILSNISMDSWMACAILHNASLIVEQETMDSLMQTCLMVRKSQRPPQSALIVFAESMLDQFVQSDRAGSVRTWIRLCDECDFCVFPSVPQSRISDAMRDALVDGLRIEPCTCSRVIFECASGRDVTRIDWFDDFWSTKMTPSQKQSALGVASNCGSHEILDRELSTNGGKNVNDYAVTVYLTGLLDSDERPIDLKLSIADLVVNKYLGSSRKAKRMLLRFPVDVHALLCALYMKYDTNPNESRASVISSASDFVMCVACVFVGDFAKLGTRLDGVLNDRGMVEMLANVCAKRHRSDAAFSLVERAGISYPPILKSVLISCLSSHPCNFDFVRRIIEQNIFSSFQITEMLVILSTSQQYMSNVTRLRALCEDIVRFAVDHIDEDDGENNDQCGPWPGLETTTGAECGLKNRVLALLIKSCQQGCVGRTAQEGTAAGPSRASQPTEGAPGTTRTSPLCSGSPPDTSGQGSDRRSASDDGGDGRDTRPADDTVPSPDQKHALEHPHSGNDS
jgi:hypothetical protein